MTLGTHQMGGLGTKLRKSLSHIFDTWLPAATMTFTNKTLTSPTLTSVTIGTSTAGIDITGTVSKGVDATDATLTQGWNNGFFTCGSGNGSSGDQHSVATTGFYIPFQCNIVSTANPSAISEFGAAMLRADVSTADQAKTSCDVLMIRSDIAKNVYAATACNISQTISDDIAVPTAAVQTVFIQMRGDGTITSPNDVNVLEVKYAQTAGGGGCNNVAQFYMIGSGCEIDSIVEIIRGAGTVTTGLNITGTMAMGMSIGKDGTIMDLRTAAGNRGINVWTTSGSTSGSTSVRPIFMKHVSTGIGGVGHRAEFHHYTNVALGGWANALKGYMECGASATTTGLMSAVNCELKLPGATIIGTYAPLEVNLVASASGTGFNVQNVSLAYMRASGDSTALAAWQTDGYIFDIWGLGSAASSSILQENTDQPTHALRIKIDDTKYYLLMTTADNGSE